jgi:hypothetical protein
LSRRSARGDGTGVSSGSRVRVGVIGTEDHSVGDDGVDLVVGSVDTVCESEVGGKSVLTHIQPDPTTLLTHWKHSNKWYIAKWPGK